MALAIVNDLGAVMIIALGPLAGAASLFALLVFFNLGGIRKSLPYFIVAVFLWYALLLSGVHATLAGILGALSVPAVPNYNPERFGEHVQELMQRFDASHQPGRSIMTNDALRAVVQTLKLGVVILLKDMRFTQMAACRCSRRSDSPCSFLPHSSVSATTTIYR